MAFHRKLRYCYVFIIIISDKNEPARFLGDGVSFKAKLIGILEVSEARGDRMCQEALADLKMAIRAAGEHKQRININIAIDGLRLRDEKTGVRCYNLTALLNFFQACLKLNFLLLVQKQRPLLEMFWQRSHKPDVYRHCRK